MQESTANKPSLLEKVYLSPVTHEIFIGQIVALLENHRDLVTNRITAHDSPPELFRHTPIPTLAAEGTPERWALEHIGDIWEVVQIFTASRIALVALDQIQSKITKKNIPDEACFWTSLIISTAIPALVELNKFPGVEGFTSSSEDLFGVGIGSMLLIGTHYLSKFHEPIKEAVVGGTQKIIEKGKEIKNKVDTSLNINT